MKFSYCIARAVGEQQGVPLQGFSVNCFGCQEMETNEMPPKSIDLSRAAPSTKKKKTFFLEGFDLSRVFVFFLFLGTKVGNDGYLYLRTTFLDRMPSPSSSSSASSQSSLLNAISGEDAQMPLDLIATMVQPPLRPVALSLAKRSSSSVQKKP